MPSIRPSSEIRNNYNEISQFCHQHDEPVYITKNGKGDLAVLSIDAYERLAGKFELHQLLNEGLADIREKRTEPLDTVFADLELELGLDLSNE